MKPMPDGWRFRSNFNGHLILQKRVGWYGDTPEECKGTPVAPAPAWKDATINDLLEFLGALDSK